MSVLRSIRRFVARIAGAKIKEDILLDDDEREPEDHRFFRRIGPRSFRGAFRDLPPFKQDEQNRQAFRAYIENAFIRRLARMTAEFIVGNGIALVSENERIQEELDAWWKDEVNDWERRHFQLAVELPLYGEVIQERVVNIFTGRHRYNWLDPLFVAGVRPHPKYPAIPADIEFWSPVGGGKVVIAKILNGVPEAAALAAENDEPETSPKIFYFRANNLSGSLRGHSAYYPLIEWADVLDNAAFSMGERMVILLTYVWHLKADNMDAENKKRWTEILQNAQPGSALLSGKDVELSAITPDLKSADFTEGARFLRTLIAGSAGVPVHFMGDGGETNLATAGAMNLPTLRSFLQQQREFVSVIRTLARANLESVARKGRIPAEAIDDFEIQVDPMNPRDNTTTATALATLVSALSGAKIEGWIADNEARQAIINILGGIVEIDQAVKVEDIGRANLPPQVTAAMRRVSDFLREEPAGEDRNGKPITPKEA